VKQAVKRLTTDKTVAAAGQGLSIAKPSPVAPVRMPKVPLRISPSVAMPTHQIASRRDAPPRRATRTGELLLGGVLALILLIACIAWEAMSGAAAPTAEERQAGAGATVRAAR
jgi:hypothetical protein